MTTILKEYIIKDKHGKSRSHVDFKCDFCSKKHIKEKRLVKNNNFCSVLCSNNFRYKDVKKIKTKCAYCKQVIIRNPSRHRAKSGLCFCSKQCKNEGQKIKNNIQDVWPSHYGLANGFHSYRKLALSHYEKKCAKCGYKKITDILQVHHIDHNRSNNDINNLQILCPNCHSIEHLCKKD
jgi:stalled ribosome alternative rescue factor ArfA